jgi:hypothetical protein
MKPTLAPSTGKRQRVSEIFEDVDSENSDPSCFSPTKKSKTSASFDLDYVKASKFSLVPSPMRSTSLAATPSTRKILAPSSTAKSTPISTSRGSPKHARIHAISKRGATRSPFRRIDPPSSSPALPFSIDAALSGTIEGYVPKAPAVIAEPAVAQNNVAALDDSMPSSWFFAIHEDTPEQEAANLMEHSASVLDISSDDDLATKVRNEDRGKENIPPADFQVGTAAEVVTEQPEVVKRPRLRKLVQDAMDEDRRPLGDLAPSDFYGEGCDASSYVTVDAGIGRPSGLSREVDFSCDEAVVEKTVLQEVSAVEDVENVVDEAVASAVVVEEARVVPDLPIASVEVVA